MMSIITYVYVCVRTLLMERFIVLTLGKVLKRFFTLSVSAS